jgi:hypothetical protein
MADKYMLPNTEQGAALRANLAASLMDAGFAVELRHETLQVGEENFTVLTLLKTGKRVGEGQIAARMMKEQKAFD